MGISPWRKRLGDLFQLIGQADQTYFEPELFRLNINNAITTARTVTFLIQKNKAKIPGYHDLYKTFVLDVCGSSPLMKWLVDARNTIEKEGDLAIHSQLRASIMFSYLENGPSIEPPCEGLLFASQNKLWRAWLRMAPESIVDESAIVIDRKWVANTLPDYELTDALLHGFSVLRSAVDAFDSACGQDVSAFAYDSLPNLSSASRREYIKLSTGKVCSFRRGRVSRTPEQLAQLKKEVEALFVDRSAAAYADASLPLRTRLQSFALMASKVFNRDGHHETMYFQTDGNGQITAATGVYFADRIEKYIFWHAMADLARIDPDFQGIFFIGEMWYRSAPIGGGLTAISDMPITGEAIALTGATAKGEYEEIHVPIKRSGDVATADFDGAVERAEVIPNFLYPLREAWGLKESGKLREDG
ncbi:hypothetical protein [Dyella sedimenti]|uniref:hypothetical protein n=1 Tax=Dyella sedimenti TaxID=2919947 RepID=UPI001FAA09D5|nr:hypothetical protein [Dyella sedimenti]